MKKLFVVLIILVIGFLCWVSIFIPLPSIVEGNFGDIDKYASDREIGYIMGVGSVIFILVIYHIFVSYIRADPKGKNSLDILVKDYNTFKEVIEKRVSDISTNTIVLSSKVHQLELKNAGEQVTFNSLMEDFKKEIRAHDPKQNDEVEKV